MSSYKSKNISSKVDFKLKTVDENHVSFTMKSIKVMKEIIPDNVNMLFINEDEVEWTFTYSIKIFEGGDLLKKIEVWLGVNLIYKNDPSKKSIVTIEYMSEFDVSNKISVEAKIKVLKILFDYTNWCIQGIYGSKLNNSPLSMIIPPELRHAVPKDYFSDLVSYDWY